MTSVSKNALLKTTMSNHNKALDRPRTWRLCIIQLNYDVFVVQFVDTILGPRPLNFSHAPLTAGAATNTLVGFARISFLNSEAQEL